MSFVSKSLLCGFMYVFVFEVVWDDLHKRFNKINGARIFNLHKKCYVYTRKCICVYILLKIEDLWEEFEALVPAPNCDCDKSGELLLYL